MYQAKEDSYFLAEQLAEYLNSLTKKEKSKLKVLDLGTGSNIQAETLVNKGIKKENILCSDIDKEVIILTNKKGFKAVNSNLFSNIKSKFDLIIFNPPYLPENKYDKQKDTAGGKQGDETILSFLRQLKKHLTKKGKAFLLLSSLTPKSRINKEIKKQKLKIKLIASKNIFFEQLEVFIISF